MGDDTRMVLARIDERVRGIDGKVDKIGVTLNGKDRDGGLVAAVSVHDRLIEDIRRREWRLTAGVFSLTLLIASGFVGWLFAG